MENKASDNKLKKKLDQLIHFKKINLIGKSRVGKANLIHFLKNHTDFNTFTEDNKTPNTELIVEKIEKVYLKYKEKNYYLNVYLTNTDLVERIISYLDTLLIYSDCIIFMADITDKVSHDNIIEILEEIDKKEKQNLPPIFYIRNKLDLAEKGEFFEDEIGDMDKFKNITKFDISLQGKKNCYEFLDKFVETLNNEPIIKEESKLVQLMDPPYLKELINLDYFQIKIYLFGPSTVGKTCFFNKFLEDRFSNISVGSCFQNSCKAVLAKINNDIIKATIWDTCGQEMYKSDVEKEYCKADGMLLLFDITQRDSFKQMENYIKSIREKRSRPENETSKTKDEILYLIGNKMDKVYDRRVTQNEVDKFAKEYNVDYYEISCQNGLNIYEVMCKLIYDCYKQKKGENCQNKIVLNKTKTKKKKKCCG